MFLCMTSLVVQSCLNSSSKQKEIEVTVAGYINPPYDRNQIGVPWFGRNAMVDTYRLRVLISQEYGKSRVVSYTRNGKTDWIDCNIRVEPKNPERFDGFNWSVVIGSDLVMFEY